MPYVTFSRKLSHGSATRNATKLMRSLFDACVVERRGAKSIRDVIATANAKGLSKVIIISEANSSKELNINLLSSASRTKAFKWLDAYKLSFSNKKSIITDDDGNEATKELVKHANE